MGSALGVTVGLIIIILYLIIFGLAPLLTHLLIVKSPYPNTYNRDYAGFWHIITKDVPRGVGIIHFTMHHLHLI